MSNAPAWLRCENCLWFKSVGCAWTLGFNHNIKILNPKDLCNKWTCKRCFRDWSQWEGEEINHLYCKIKARKKPGKEKR